MELRVALEHLLDRYPNMRLDPEAEEPVVSGVLWRLVNHLPVILD
jgi:hypothetical protein